VLDWRRWSLTFCPFSNEIRQDLRLDGAAWCVCYILPHQLEGSLGYPSFSVGVLDHLSKWVFGHHRDWMRIEIVSKLMLGDKDNIY
jgi:hypothetical protein